MKKLTLILLLMILRNSYADLDIQKECYEGGASQLELVKNDLESYKQKFKESLGKEDYQRLNSCLFAFSSINADSFDEEALNVLADEGLAPDRYFSVASWNPHQLEKLGPYLGLTAAKKRFSTPEAYKSLREKVIPNMEGRDQKDMYHLLILSLKNSRFGSLDDLAFLLEKGIQINFAEDFYKWDHQDRIVPITQVVFEYALSGKENPYEILKLLLKNGLIVNQQVYPVHSIKVSPFSLIRKPAWARFKDMVMLFSEELLKQGGDPQITFGTGGMQEVSPYSIAQAMGMNDLVALYDKFLNGEVSEMTVEEKWFEAAFKGELGVLNRLMKDVDVDTLSRTEEATALIIAAGAGHLEVVRALVKAGADINKRDQFGQNARELADLNGHEVIAEYLSRL